MCKCYGKRKGKEKKNPFKTWVKALIWDCEFIYVEES